MKINKITPTSNYNSNKNVNINNKSTRTQSCSVDNNYAKVQSPMFCGIFTNLERLKQQHKIVNKAYRIYGESIRALNQANYIKENVIVDAIVKVKNGNINLDSMFLKDNKTNDTILTKFDKKSKVEQIFVNPKLNKDDEVVQADEIYTFFNGKLDSYVIGYSVNDLDETIEIDAEYNYENGEISSYSKKVVIDSETSEINVEETFSYEYSQLTEYAQNVHFYPLNDNVEALKHYAFLNDKLISVHKNYSAYNNPND